MAPSTFAERYGFARWLRHLATGEAPSFAEIGRAVERTGQAVSAWASAAEAPTDWRVHEPLAQFLGVQDGWLVKNVGDPPRPELWTVWLGARRPAPPKRLGPSVLKDDYVENELLPRRKPAAKKRGA